MNKSNHIVKFERTTKSIHDTLGTTENREKHKRTRKLGKRQRGGGLKGIYQSSETHGLKSLDKLQVYGGVF